MLGLVETIKKVTGGGADYVIEATGAPPCIKLGWSVGLVSTRTGRKGAELMITPL